VFWFYECKFIIYWQQTCFGHSCGYLQGDKCKNISVFLVWWYHCTVTIIRFCLKFRLIDKTVMGVWYFKLKLLSGVWFSEVMHIAGICGGLWSILLSDGAVCTVDSFSINRNFNQNHMILTVQWSQHTNIIFLFFDFPPWRWPNEWRKHVCGRYVINLHS
jgi:hypothetical protein